MKLKRALTGLVGLVAIVGLTGCTPEEVNDWLKWNRTDPASAQAYLSQPEVATAMASVDIAAVTAEAVRLNPPPPPPPVSNNSVWDRLAQCESGGNWAINTGNGYYGGLQFLPSTWRNSGGSGMPHQNSREEQIRVASNLRDSGQGYRPWPQCARRLGLL